MPVGFQEVCRRELELGRQKNNVQEVRLTVATYKTFPGEASIQLIPTFIGR